MFSVLRSMFEVASTFMLAPLLTLTSLDACAKRFPPEEAIVMSAEAPMFVCPPAAIMLTSVFPCMYVICPLRPKFSDALTLTLPPLDATMRLFFAPKFIVLFALIDTNEPAEFIFSGPSDCTDTEPESVFKYRFCSGFMKVFPLDFK